MLRANDQDTRRERGAYYTPPFLTRTMLAGCVGPLLAADPQPDRPPVRILDPACGDGAFLVDAFDLLQDWYCDRYRQQPEAFAERVGETADGWRLVPAERLRIVREHLFGVDLDPAAVELLRSRLRERIGFGEEQADVVEQVLRTNIRCGDALIGADFRTDSGQAGSLPYVLDWRAAFPQVAEAGGFDVIVGNPPYRRELYAKELFDRIAASPLGKKWRQPRMDLWFYFLHRGLDLLRPGGRLSFVVNSYWTASTGAAKLIARLAAETTFEEILLLGSLPVFRDVAGRHLVFRLRQGAHSQNCRVFDFSTTSAAEARPFSRDAKSSERSAPCGPSAPLRKASASRLNGLVDSPAADRYEISQRDLFRDGRLSVNQPDRLLDSLQTDGMLSEMFEVRQGIAENPPSITPRLARELAAQFRSVDFNPREGTANSRRSVNFNPREDAADGRDRVDSNPRYGNGDAVRLGEGVFVLTADEVAQLELSAAERAVLRPYYATASLGRYRIPEGPTHFLLYLTRRTAPSLDDMPRIRAHLERFRPILDRRRETRKGLIAWWHLHWPREERLFTEPRLLSVQMGKTPQFVWAERPTFVGFSVNVILASAGGNLSSRPGWKPTLRGAFSLPVLCGILNSEPARRWFSQYAKHRGVNLEINGRLLRRFPLPQRNAEVEEEIGVLVARRRRMSNDDAEPVAEVEEHRLDAQIDRLVWRLYGIHNSEVRIGK